MIGQTLFASLTPAEALATLMETPEPVELTKEEAESTAFIIARPDEMDSLLAFKIFLRFGLLAAENMVTHSEAKQRIAQGRFLLGFHWIDQEEYREPLNGVRRYYSPTVKGYVVTSMKPKGSVFLKDLVMRAAENCFVAGASLVDGTSQISVIDEGDVREVMQKLVPGGRGILIVRHGKRIDAEVFYQPGFNFKQGIFYEGSETAFSALFITKMPMIRRIRSWAKAAPAA